MRRSTNGSTITLTLYAFGLEDHVYSGAGTNQSNTSYYTPAGHLIGALDSSGTTFYLTDALGSLLTSFTNAANAAQVKGEQDYAPYGPSRYTQGTINTPKGYTGQYNDSLTGLDYYGARYYDPVVGVFLSADKVEGNLQGMNPYGYVSGNPETRNDPTGQLSAPVCPANDCNTTGDGGVAAATISAAIADYMSNLLRMDLLNEIFNGVGGGTHTTSPMTTSVSSGMTSCGAPGSQALCGHFGVNFAIYFGPFQLGVPGGWCLECGGVVGDRGIEMDQVEGTRLMHQIQV